MTDELALNARMIEKIRTAASNQRNAALGRQAKQDRLIGNNSSIGTPRDVVVGREDEYLTAVRKAKQEFEVQKQLVEQRNRDLKEIETCERGAIDERLGLHTDL